MTLSSFGSAQTNILDLVHNGRTEELRHLVKAAPSALETRAADGSSLLQQAIYRRRPEVAALLLELGYQPDFYDACAIGDLSTIQPMLRADPKLAASFSPDGFPALALTVFFGHREAAVALLRAGAPVNTKSKDRMEITPLHSAVARRDEFLVALLLSHGADPNAAESAGGTALHSAAAAGESSLVKWLLSNGADKGVRNQAGETALDLAKRNSHQEIIAILER